MLALFRVGITITSLGLITIVIQWDEVLIKNISPKTVTNSEKYPYYIPEGMMFVIGIHEHRDQDYPKQSTVER